MSDDYDDETTGGIVRFLPAVVVIGALAGFISLAWYAYHTGTQSVKEEELLLVEAEKTPVKEKPLDPGGMKFPNQDKTVFETFSAGGQQPAKVERVLPTPEEPMAKKTDEEETKSWNRKEEVQPAAAPAPVVSVVDEEQAAPAPAIAVTKKVEEPVQPKVEAVKTEPAKPVETAKPKVAEKPASGKFKIQLGAYKSEKEAKDEWAKIQKKFSALSGKTPVVVKADLGEKGVFYRLRAGGFASAADAKAMCATLSAKGQACILPTS